MVGTSLYLTRSAQRLATWPLVEVDEAVGFMCHLTAKAPSWGAGQSGVVLSKYGSEGGKERGLLQRNKMR